MSKLTAKQQKFITEYIVDLNAYQSAIRAGYSPNSALRASERLLQNVAIREAIAELREKQDAPTLKKRHDILMALEQIIFTSPADYCEMGADGLWYIHIGPEIPQDKKMPIKSITSRTTEAGAVISKVECYDKLKAIDTYCKLRGWLEKDVNIDNRTQTVNLIMPDNGRRNPKPDAPTRTADRFLAD